MNLRAAPLPEETAGGRRIALEDTVSTLFFHSDHLGSASVITERPFNADPEEASYFPFGNIRPESTNPTGGVNYKCTGQERDAETGLYNYKARLYDPALGRFISPDPIVQSMQNPQFLNRYSYVANNPINYIDPSGNTSHPQTPQWDPNASGQFSCTPSPSCNPTFDTSDITFDFSEFGGHGGGGSGVAFDTGRPCEPFCTIPGIDGPSTTTGGDGFGGFPGGCGSVGICVAWIPCNPCQGPYKLPDPLPMTEALSSHPRSSGIG